MITAPFNFVPLSEKVFFPSWSERVSLDIPFSDGESGIIDITITAKSPIFIRNHYVEGDDFYINSTGNKVSTKFCHYKGIPYIPGSSVKGMIRNVLEIMSFSKIVIDKESHSRVMSVRDMTNRKELVGTANGCGFLKQNENGEWIIVDYGKPRTIAYTNIANKTIKNGRVSINCNFDTAMEKYNENGLYQRISVKTSVKDLKNRDGKKIGTKNIATLKSGESNAYLVLTGGIDNKKNEFVFADSDKKEEPISNIDLAVEKFKKVYFESDSIDGNFWKENWDRDTGIPIFYKKQNGKITDIGLSQLFKLAYNFTIDDATKQVLEITKIRGKEFIKLDLAETIFGTIEKSLDGKESNALKGRVQFSHFKIEDSNVKEYGEVFTVLGSPRASFYPEYIAQNCIDGKVQNNKYHTLMNEYPKIAGWKRYPLHKGKPTFTPAEEGTDSATKFKPLGTYSGNKFNEFTFRGKVRFHNLTKVELGALLSALSFHANEDTFYHNIGLAKSLGFGKIKIDLDLEPYKDALVAYELMMNQWTQTNLAKEWIKTEQIKELFTMAYKDLNIDDKLKYLKLNPDEKINEFVDAKKNKECLPKVSELFNIGDNYPKSLLTQEEIEKFKQQEAIKALKEKEQKEWQILKESDNISAIESFINRYPESEFLQEAQDRIKAIKEELQKQKEQAQHKEALEKWEAVLNADKKYKKQALEDYIKKYPNSPKIKEAKGQLKKLTAPKQQNKDKSFDLSNAEDASDIERAIKHIQNPTDSDKEKLEEAIKRIYPNLNAKKKRKLQKSKVIIKWLTQERLNALINSL